MSAAYDGDLIRLIRVSAALYFAYAEAEIDTLIDALPSNEVYDDQKTFELRPWATSLYMLKNLSIKFKQKD